MSGCQAYGPASEEGHGDGGNLAEEPMVIARLPDMGRNHDYKKSEPSPADAISAFPRRWPVLPKKVIGVAGAVVLLVMCWSFFAGSDSDPESLRPAPPAASAPEAPLWNGETGPQAMVASKVPRTSATSTKLDEVLPRGTTLASKISPVKPVKKTPPKKTKPKEPPRATSNRPLVVGTPIPPENATVNNRDWTTLSDSEYYWAVRWRTEAKAYRTAAKPNSGLSPQYPAGGRPSGQGTARLNGVIETPTVRVY